MIQPGNQLLYSEREAYLLSTQEQLKTISVLDQYVTHADKVGRRVFEASQCGYPVLGSRHELTGRNFGVNEVHRFHNYVHFLVNEFTITL